MQLSDNVDLVEEMNTLGFDVTMPSHSASRELSQEQLSSLALGSSLYDSLSADVDIASHVELTEEDGAPMVVEDKIDEELIKELFNKLDIHYNTQITVLELVKCAKCPENLQEDVDFSECRSLLYSLLGFTSTPDVPISDVQMDGVDEVRKGMEDP